MPYQLVNFEGTAAGKVHAGVVINSTVYPIQEVLSGSKDSLQAVYEDWVNVEKRLRTISPSDGGIPLEEVTLLPPSLKPSAIYFAGFNYKDHVDSMMKALGHPPEPHPKELGIPPWHGLKPRNTLCGSGHTVELPPTSKAVDWEIELAVVIGKTARRISVNDALSYVAGYTIGIDLSARDLAFRPHTPADSVSRMDWLATKGFQDACPLGPWLVPASQISDPQNLSLKLSINGVVKQNSNTKQMLFTVAESIAHLSSIVTLSPGDVILTGTPAGCGAETGEFLKHGDTVEAWIEDIGELVIHIA